MCNAVAFSKGESMAFSSKDGKLHIPGVGYLPKGFSVGDFDPKTDYAPIADLEGNYRGSVHQAYGGAVFSVDTENRFGTWEVFMSSKQY